MLNKSQNVLVLETRQRHVRVESGQSQGDISDVKSGVTERDVKPRIPKGIL